MFSVGKQVVLEMTGTQYDGKRAMVVEKENSGLFKVQLLELDNFGKTLVVSKYQVKD